MKSIGLLLVLVGIIALVMAVFSCQKEEVLNPPVPQPIQITQQPLGGTVCENGKVEISVHAQCSGDLHYQWEALLDSGWSHLGFDQPTYETEALTKSTTYRVLVYSTDSLCLSTYSTLAIVDVIPDVEIIILPVDTVVGVNEIFSLRVVAASGSLLHYQWEMLAGNTWMHIGNDSSVVQIPGLMGSAQFRVSIYVDDVMCSRDTSPVINVTVGDISRLTGWYTGICYTEYVQNDITTWTQTTTYDTIEPAARKVIIDETIGDTSYIIRLVPDLFPSAKYWIYPVDLELPVIVKSYNISVYSTMVTFEPEQETLHTYYASNNWPYHRTSVNCYYTRI